jgi:hypothetical protein
VRFKVRKVPQVVYPQTEQLQDSKVVTACEIITATTACHCADPSVYIVSTQYGRQPFSYVGVGS